MGDSRIEKAEIADVVRRIIREELHPFAEAAAARQAELERRIFLLGLAFDCLVTVVNTGAWAPSLSDALKLEVQRRRDAAEHKAKQENKPLVSVP